MAGNTVTITGQLQPVQGYDISYIDWKVEIRQPSAGAIRNPQGRLTVTIYHDTQGSGGTSTQAIRVSTQIADPIDPHDYGSLAYNCPQVSANSQTFTTDWTTLYINHTTGYDTFTVRTTCAGGGSGAVSTKSQSGKIYWTEGGGGGGTTTYTIYYQSDGVTIDTQSVTAGSSFTLHACSITKSGYTFNGWTNGGRTYPVGYSFTPMDNLWFSASWVETDQSSTSQYIWIYAANQDDKVYASTSSIMGTSAYQNGTKAVRINCTHNGSVLAPTKVEILPEADGQSKNANSFAIRVKWGSGDIYQEIVLGCSDSSINGANWVTSHGVTLSPTTNDTNPSSITVSRYNIEGGKGSTVTGVTLNDYWIANQGYTSGVSDTSVGSWNTPAVWYWHLKNLGDDTPDTAENRAKIARKISWTPPENGTPLYYVIMYWKGYYTWDEREDDKLGYVAVVNGSATSMTDSSGWFSGNYSGAEMKIVVHAVYAGGPNPTFFEGETNSYSDAATGMGKSAIEDYAIWWQWGTPPSLYNIKFYEQDKSTILIDSSGNEYNYYAPTNANIVAPTEIKINGVDQTEAYILNGWYKKVGTGSWGTTILTNLGAVGTSSLSFAQAITKRTYRVVYNTTATATSSQTFEHGTTIYINNDNGTSTVTYVVKQNYTIPIPSKTDYVFNGFTYNSSTKTFTAQWIAATRKIWIYTGSQWQQGIPWIYNGSQWKQGKSAFIYSSGWKEER